MIVIFRLAAGVDGWAHAGACNAAWFNGEVGEGEACDGHCKEEGDDPAAKIGPVTKVFRRDALSLTLKPSRYSGNRRLFWWWWWSIYGLVSRFEEFGAHPLAECARIFWCRD